MEGSVPLIGWRRHLLFSYWSNTGAADIYFFFFSGPQLIDAHILIIHPALDELLRRTVWFYAFGNSLKYYILQTGLKTKTRSGTTGQMRCRIVCTDKTKNWINEQWNAPHPVDKVSKYSKVLNLSSGSRYFHQVLKVQCVRFRWMEFIILLMFLRVSSRLYVYLYIEILYIRGLKLKLPGGRLRQYLDEAGPHQVFHKKNFSKKIQTSQMSLLTVI